MRPTLTVQNTTSSQPERHAHAMNFKCRMRRISRIGASLTASFLVSVSQTGVTEGGDGRTSFTVGSGVAADHAHVLAARVRSGNDDVDWSVAGNVQDEARWLQQARRVVRPA